MSQQRQQFRRRTEEGERAGYAPGLLVFVGDDARQQSLWKAPVERAGIERRPLQRYFDGGGEGSECSCACCGVCDRCAAGAAERAAGGSADAAVAPEVARRRAPRPRPAEGAEAPAHDASRAPAAASRRRRWRPSARGRRGADAACCTGAGRVPGGADRSGGRRSACRLDAEADPARGEAARAEAADEEAAADGTKTEPEAEAEARHNAAADDPGGVAHTVTERVVAADAVGASVLAARQRASVARVLT